MAIATFHSLRGEKSALLLVKKNKFEFSATPVYVPASAVEGLSEGDTLELPDGFSVVPMVSEDGVERTTKTGEVLMMLVW
jgi:hypothetical protein